MTSYICWIKNRNLPVLVTFNVDQSESSLPVEPVCDRSVLSVQGATVDTVAAL